eukprot:399422-Pyramimonas_sp.AAC.2
MWAALYTFALPAMTQVRSGAHHQHQQQRLMLLWDVVDVGTACHLFHGGQCRGVRAPRCAKQPTCVTAGTAERAR